MAKIWRQIPSGGRDLAEGVGCGPCDGGHDLRPSQPSRAGL